MGVTRNHCGRCLHWGGEWSEAAGGQGGRATNALENPRLSQGGPLATCAPLRPVQPPTPRKLREGSFGAPPGGARCLRSVEGRSSAVPDTPSPLQRSAPLVTVTVPSSLLSRSPAREEEGSARARRRGRRSVSGVCARPLPAREEISGGRRQRASPESVGEGRQSKDCHQIASGTCNSFPRVAETHLPAALANVCSKVLINDYLIINLRLQKST